MDGLSQQLRGNEWYAFLTLQLPQEAFNQRYFYSFTTVEIGTGIESSPKVTCEPEGKHYT
jgi:hypothetical protein